MKKANHEPHEIIELASSRQSQNVNELNEDALTFGDKTADALADFAGSWKFIIIFCSILFAWILINSMQLFVHIFDPYPFILLNLVLSCVAAMQAPVIMMSQNRQEKRDRLRGELDYNVNLKAEILIEELLKRLNKLEQGHEKILNELNEIKSNQHE